MLFVFFIIGLFFIYIFMTMPSPRKLDLKEFKDIDYAHRGLHDNNSDAKENSLLAIKKAIDNSYGIEFDIRLSKDGQIIVFHDDNLKRMCGIDKKVRDLSLDELKNIKLLNSSQNIPLFKEVLDLVNGKVPLIIELKCDFKDVDELAQKTSELLNKYKGPFMLESFNPKAMQWFKINKPGYIRGQLSSGFFPTLNLIENFLMSKLLINFLSRPDFIAYDHRYRCNIALKIQKYIYKNLMVCYTVKNISDYKINKKFFELIIFEGFSIK